MYLLTPALWPALVAFLALSLPMLVTDAREFRLPLPLNLGLLTAGAVLLGAASIWTGPERLLTAGISLAAASVLMVAIFAISRGALGFGDVILVAGLSLYTGFVSPIAMLAALWCGSLATLVWALLRRRRGNPGPTPYGPGLILASLAALLLPIPVGS